METPALDQIREKLSSSAKDIKLNVSAVFNSEVLSADQIFGVALASSYYLKDQGLVQALLTDAKFAGVSESIINDAKSAASLMAMNTVYYRFRHFMNNENYNSRPARLRMQAMTAPASGKANFELFSLAVAALAGCEMCVKAHEASVVQHGLSQEHVHECVRIAAVINGLVVSGLI